MEKSFSVTCTAVPAAEPPVAGLLVPDPPLLLLLHAARARLAAAVRAMTMRAGVAGMTHLLVWWHALANTAVHRLMRSFRASAAGKGAQLLHGAADGGR
jgi:hypothetical protein